MNNTDAEILIRSLNDVQRGRFGETIVANVLAASGVHYIPLAKINDRGAPLARSNDGSLILPDLDCASDKWTAFVEVKCKSHPILYRRTRKLRHGFDRPNFAHYMKASERFRKQCGVAIVELWNDEFNKLWSGTLLMESLNELPSPDYEIGQFVGSREEKVYWDRKLFRDLDSYNPCELVAIAEGRLRPTFKVELETIFHRLKQTALF